jgi:sugar lactone lactonase YvrE
MPSIRSFGRVALATTGLFVAIACTAQQDEAPAAAAKPAPRDVNVAVAVVETGLSTPESVLWDATNNVWYVSNINGGPLQKDDNGYIVRLTADGAVKDSVPFINGTDADVTLHAPKGMALAGDTLWVADIDALRGFSVTTGRPVGEVSLASLGATFLNDVAVGGEGEVYVTDSGISLMPRATSSTPAGARCSWSVTAPRASR